MAPNPTSPPKIRGSTANIYDRATSTIIDAIEPSPPPTGRPWVGGAVYAKSSVSCRSWLPMTSRFRPFSRWKIGRMCLASAPWAKSPRDAPT